MTAAAAEMDAEARIAVPVAVVRDEPDTADRQGQSVTHALLGEPVHIVAERAGWSEIRLPQQPSSLSPDGYPGWVPSSHLVAADGAAGQRASVTSALTVRSEGKDPIELSFGTILPVVELGDGSVTLRHPDGRDVVVARTALHMLGGSAQPASALRLARLFAGLPYLWSGLSGSGVDCSGLVHLAYRAIGVVVPRDAADQERAGHAIELTDAGPGDPVFFESDRGVHHVGLVVDEEWMLHSPRTGADVRDERIDTADYAGERRLVRRFPLQNPSY